MTLEDSVQAQRLHVLRRAEELGNASAACREAGVSRSLFYRWKQRMDRYGADGLHPKQTQARRGRPPAVPAHVERQVMEFRRRYFTQLPQLQRSLDSFLRFYNHDRPHHGYRTRGRTPAEILRGAGEEA